MNQARFKRISISLWISIILLSLIFVFKPNTSPMIVKGDFPAFYATAKIMCEKEPEDVYNVKAQQQIQGQYWETLGEEYYFFSYPPYVAKILQPLCSFSRNAAKIITTIILSVFVFFTGYLLFLIKDNRYKFSSFDLFPYLFLFPPMFASILAGQNPPISVFLFTLLIYGLKLNNLKGDSIAGTALGLWLYKPHFPILFIFFLGVVSKRYVILLASSFVGILYYLIAYLDFGLYWPIGWFEKVKFFVSLENQNNFYNMISLDILFKIVSNNYYFSLIPTLIKILIFLVFLKYFIKLRNSWNKDESIYLCLSLYPTILLISPHSMFYESSLAIPIIIIAFAVSKLEILNYKKYIFYFMLLYTYSGVIMTFRNKFFSPFAFSLFLIFTIYLVNKIKNRVL